jgi:Cu+-exporting ATPase
MLSPVIAGAAMAFSSLSVVLNALTLQRWRGAADAPAEQRAQPSQAVTVRVGTRQA